MSSNFEREHSELPIPNGWFAVAFSKDIVKGEVKAIHYFDTDLVLFRTREGHARVLDAFLADRSAARLSDLDDVLQVDAWARRSARELIGEARS